MKSGISCQELLRCIVVEPILVVTDLIVTQRNQSDINDQQILMKGCRDITRPFREKQMPLHEWRLNSWKPPFQGSNFSGWFSMLLPLIASPMKRSGCAGRVWVSLGGPSAAITATQFPADPGQVRPDEVVILIRRQDRNGPSADEYFASR